jgi:hypothetical protein
MHNKHRTVLIASAVLSVGLMQGCATRIKASSTDNPPPPQAFSAYSRIDVKPVVFKQGYKGDQAGLAKIDENLKKDLAPKLATWNARPSNGSALVVEPVVEEMSFKHGAKRVLLGPLAGGSGVLMRVTIRDNTGKVVATPEFFQRTAAFSGGFTLGAMDNMMLTRVANLASGYIIANYDKAVGGPTGADDKAVQPN